MCILWKIWSLLLLLVSSLLRIDINDICVYGHINVKTDVHTVCDVWTENNKCEILKSLSSHWGQCFCFSAAFSDLM